jgi:signal transduction histidine kinase
MHCVGSRTVTHINDLISRLNLFRHELTIQPQECDLNQIVKEALNGQTQGGVEVTQDLRDIPTAKLDPSQIHKVVTNLLINAREAIGTQGKIHVETSSQNGWLILSVSDTGSGMSPEFIQSRLFRPFQTTKKNGIGIGMFHCKMITEAHHGRIEVESQPGKGSLFRVLLPISGKAV